MGSQSERAFVGRVERRAIRHDSLRRLVLQLLQNSGRIVDAAVTEGLQFLRLAMNNNTNVQTLRKVPFMKCPHCHSESTRRFSVIYDDGTQHQKIVTKTDGLIAVGKDLASYGGTTETETTSHTTLARRCQPPEKPSVPLGPIRRFLGSLVLALVAAAAVLIVVGVVDEFIGQAIWNFLGGSMDSVVGAHVLFVGVPAFIVLLGASRRRSREDAEYNRVYPGLRAKWERAWLCMKCGRDYEE